MRCEQQARRGPEIRIKQVLYVHRCLISLIEELLSKLEVPSPRNAADQLGRVRSANPTEAEFPTQSKNTDEKAEVADATP